MESGLDRRDAPGVTGVNLSGDSGLVSGLGPDGTSLSTSPAPTTPARAPGVGLINLSGGSRSLSTSTAPTTPGLNLSGDSGLVSGLGPDGTSLFITRPLCMGRCSLKRFVLFIPFCTSRASEFAENVEKTIMIICRMISKPVTEILIAISARCNVIV